MPAPMVEDPVFVNVVRAVIVVSVRRRRANLCLMEPAASKQLLVRFERTVRVDHVVLVVDKGAFAGW